MNSAVKIIQPAYTDLVRIAQCHRKAFPNTLSTAMGQVYVEKMLEWYLLDDRAFIFFLEKNGNCIGYCGGLKFDGKSPVGSASSMIQHSYHAAVVAMLKRPWLFVHPEFLKKYRLAFKNIWRRILRKMGFYTTVKPACTDIPPHTGLIVIGVDPAFQGKGYGALMLAEFERLSNQFGYTSMMLTVKTSNAKAIKSYQRNGWVITQSDKKSTTMEKVKTKFFRLS
jgi:ribosomal protein S18 acetylase RimI-like enzyme